MRAGTKSPTTPKAERSSKSAGIDYSKWDSLEVSDSDNEEEEHIDRLAREFAAISGYGKSDGSRPVDAAGGKKELRVEDQDSKQQKHIQEAEKLHEQYMSQHVSTGTFEHSMANQLCDSLNARGLAKLAPSYKSGINPNYFDEYFAELEPNDITNTEECRYAIWNEYEQRRWSYCQHLSGYHQGLCHREVDKVEFWRRFNLRAQPPPSLTRWYFDKDRKIGDVLPHYAPTEYLSDVPDVIYQSFSNCPVPPNPTLAFGTVHVAVGFVDLGLLLDSQFLDTKGNDPSAMLLFRGFEANSFSVAKSLVLWEMLCTSGMKAKWVVQVWFSTIWSKRATNMFLAAARRVAAVICCENSSEYPQKVCDLVQHWSHSKGVGLNKLVKRRSSLRKESSDALFFACKEDRSEMVRYHLTGAFGLLGEEPCSGSVLMFDCPPASVRHEAASVFETLTLQDVLSSELFNGNYFQTAERVKEARVSKLLKHAQSGKIDVRLSVSFLKFNSKEQKEIARLQPRSISWSNILDYMLPDKFHALAKACSATAIHSGSSMNWRGIIYGASLIDYPGTSLEVIRDAEQATNSSLQKLCKGRHIFLTPIQSNPLNITLDDLISWPKDAIRTGVNTFSAKREDVKFCNQDCWISLEIPSIASEVLCQFRGHTSE